ncbi:M13-type metalloendopeptidase [Caulobacter segnis]|uniref:M13 family metallopeptidase n=1 Tax=Caulobacter segnis TaxID=88688 RepID=UPI00240F8850|nr:M13-type metalloendopeptidase [Caulobacter segnis]MDG2520797.1 M13-type metalloendopeptidase [Caulobacter segnis]
MKTAWLGAAAAGALLMSAAGASAHEHKDCLDALCHMQSLDMLAQGAASGGTVTSLESPRYGTWGYDLSGRDLTAKPGDDFFKFANGTWEKNTEIPADRTRFGNFDKLSLLSEARSQAIIQNAASGKLQDKDAAKIGDAYNAFMNEALAEQLGAKPLAPELAQIRAVKTKVEFAGLMGKTHSTGFVSLFPSYISADEKDPSKYAVYLLTGGLGLPDRDYYLEAKFAEKKAAYLAYVQQMLTLAGWENPAEHAKAVVDFETRLAQVSWTRIEKRDANKTYALKTRAELDAYAPGFDWGALLTPAGLGGVKSVVLTTDTAFPKFVAVYNETSLDTLKAWQAFHLADDSAPYLSKAFVDAQFNFRGKTLSGQPEQRPRWKRAVANVNGMMGEAVGRAYVAEYFPPESKAKMLKLVADIRGALHDRIEALPWMGADTKAKALEKLSKFTVKIGYPDEWRDYSGLTVKKDDLYGNVLRSSAFEWKRDVDRLGGPVDRKEWGMTPQTVNAYYNPPLNEIVFPAAILQAPFFDPQADDAINYGGIGGVIGHEIGHGFDDQGRSYDGDGVLKDWWTAEDAAKFKTQADKLGAQYSAFEPLPGAKVQGGLTMGENIGDLAGLTLGLEAYHRSLNGKPAPVLDGLTGDQRVFLGWAQVWRQKIRDEALRQQVVTDPHSPAYYRVNGTIRNIDGWYKAFDIKPGDALYIAPENRVRLW